MSEFAALREGRKVPARLRRNRPQSSSRGKPVQSSASAASRTKSAHEIAIRRLKRQLHFAVPWKR